MACCVSNCDVDLWPTPVQQQGMNGLLPEIRLLTRSHQDLHFEAANIVFVKIEVDLSAME
jgi:hypothetical protein